MRTRGGRRDRLRAAAALLAALPAIARADVLCSKHSGVVVRRTACKKKETALDLSQFGAVGPKGDPGPSTVYVDERESADGLTNAFLTAPNPIASLSLPAGSYLVIGKGTAEDFDPSNSVNSFECDLRAGNDVIDQSFSELGRLATSTFLQEAVVTVMATIDLPVAGTVTLNCANNGANQSSIVYAKLVAVQTGSLQVQP